jgi:hypothetical protein
MDNIERDLKQMFERRSSDVVLPRYVTASLRSRARRQRFIAASSGLFLMALILTGGFVALVQIVTDPTPVTHISNGKAVQVPPPSLRKKVPPGFRSLINRNLVLLYKDGHGYVAYSEGIFRLICAADSSRRACVTTAQRTPIPKKGWPGSGTHWAFHKNSDDLSLPTLGPDVKVLWRGTPRSGSIGIKSPGACDRIVRFQPEFTCNAGVPAYRPYRADAISVPLVVGMQVDRAASRLGKAGWVPRIVGSVPEGRDRRSVTPCLPVESCPAVVVARGKVIVIEQQPIPGTVTDPGSPVTLIAGVRTELQGRGINETATCPRLLAPGLRAVRRARETGLQWAQSHKAQKSSGFKAIVTKAKGDPQGPCNAEVWKHSWVVTIQWRYPPGSPEAQSSSLAESTIFEGRTKTGWKVWFRFH